MKRINFSTLGDYRVMGHHKCRKYGELGFFLPFFQSLWIDYAEVTKKEDMTWTISLWYARARNSWKRPRILHSIAQKGWDFFPFFVIWQKRKKFRNWHFASSLDFSTLLSDVVCDFSLFCIELRHRHASIWLCRRSSTCFCEWEKKQFPSTTE